ncbi:MAG: hypothetical protein HY820_26030 [Acidobacteria bacterium]|nr:hypothetical protein [Acidobacteriota bacterium]
MLALFLLTISVVLDHGQQPMNEPFGVDFDRSGNWYIVEHKGQRILRVARDGKVSVFAGTGDVGRTGDGGPAAQARFFDPHGIAITKNGAWMYVADTRNHMVRRIDMKGGLITTVAGTGAEGFSGDGGPAVQATFKGTFGIALAPDDKALYIADLGNKRVRKLDLRTGVVTTAASGLADPRAVAVDSKGRLYILERNGHSLKVRERDGSLRTVAGPENMSPPMKGPKHIAMDRKDRVVIADAEVHYIRRYDPRTGRTEIIAGTGKRGTSVTANDALKTELNRPHGVFITRSGDLYIVDSYNHRILRMQEK